jgi:hypothetical protein
MIDEARVERAIHWLAENADAAAKARAEREYLDAYTRTLKAEIMREHDDLPLSAQEREAYADERYRTHLLGLREAIERDELMRWRRVTAETLVSAWQSMARMQKP